MAALAGGVALLWDGRSVAISEVPAVPLAPVTSGPAASVSGPSAGVAPGPFADAVPDAVPDAPGADPATAADAPPATRSTTGIAPTSVPGLAVPPGPEPTPVLDPPPSTPVTTTDSAPQPPRIVGQDVSPPQLGLRGCPGDRADVRVTLAAGALATAVVLSWTGAGESGSMPMRGLGPTWSGSLGPFGEPGRVQWSVTASNVAGLTTGPVEEITVTSCTVPGTIG